MSTPIQFDCPICGSKLKKVRVPGTVLFRGTNQRGQKVNLNNPATHFVCMKCHNVQTFSHFTKRKVRKKPTK